MLATHTGFTQNQNTLFKKKVKSTSHIGDKNRVKLENYYFCLWQFERSMLLNEFFYQNMLYTTYYKPGKTPCKKQIDIF